MDLSKVNYILHSRSLDFGFSKEVVQIAVCLADAECVGIGLSEQEALKNMCKELVARYPEGVGRLPDDGISGCQVRIE